MDIADWLGGLGLEKYAPAFDENAINWDVLSGLTTDDPKEIGVAALGDRRRLLAAIAALGEGALPAAPVPVRSSIPAEAERRQLTVMFCDLVGSTPLSTRFDPEDLREIVGAYHRCVTDTVGRFGGFVAKYMGDGVLIYFGYPEAHEDDAERSARAGLAAIDAVGRLATQEPLNVRLGIATGLVVWLATSSARVLRRSGAWSARAGSSAASRHCARGLHRWSAATRSSTCYCGAGSRQSPAKGGWCWSPASRASASRA